jgi:hypothetical protein
MPSKHSRPSCSPTSCPMTSNPPSPSRDDAVERYRAWRELFERKLAAREARITQITAYARAKGLDANPVMVNRHLQWFERWYAGYLATGHLMGRTGLVKIPRDTSSNGGV